MVFSHSLNCFSKGKFSFSGNVKAVANKVLTKPIFSEFWYGFCFRTSNIEMTETDELIFTVGEASKPDLGENAYAINVEQNGICIVAGNEKTLVQGYITLLDLIAMEDCGKSVYINCCNIAESPRLKNRMVHYCVFPENGIWELKRFVRLCGALKYSHIIIEFWGTFKYDCLKELSWECGFTKEELAPIFKEAHDLGLQIIPMINQWGHATAGRVMHGKHVVLDQNPSLQYYFTPDGWCWNINNPKTKELLKAMRREVIELCGEGEYFHIGCDEAYGFEFNEENIKNICAYIKEVNEDIKSLGRKTVMWGDMLLHKHKEYIPENRYVGFCPDLETESLMLNNIPKDIIIADWQYWMEKSPVETSIALKNAGFEVIICPWDNTFNGTKASIETIENEGLCGIMHTTWHTLSSGMNFVTITAAAGWQKLPEKWDDTWHTKTAALLRKVYHTGTDYEKAGWGKFEIGTIV